MAIDWIHVEDNPIPDHMYTDKSSLLLQDEDGMIHRDRILGAMGDFKSGEPIADAKPVLAEVPCPKCDGYGWYADHSPHPHPDGDCCGECPIQVECENCQTTGMVTV